MSNLRIVPTNPATQKRTDNAVKAIRLADAAPDLLEALALVLKYPDVTGDAKIERDKVIRAAIAKATGQAGQGASNAHDDMQELKAALAAIRKATGQGEE